MRDAPLSGPMGPSPRPAGGVCVVMNPGSGSQTAQQRRTAVAKAFGDLGLRHDVRMAGRGDDLSAMARRAASEGFDVVAAAGGDGTINAVASGLADGPAEARPRLGIIPSGTFNYVARGFGVPEEVEAAAAVIAEGYERPLDLGALNGRIFLNNASLGAYPLILRRREAIYRQWGRSRFAAHWSVLEVLSSFRAAMRLEVLADGRLLRLRTPLVFIARNAFQLDQFGLEGRGHIEAGRFAVFVAPDAGRGGLVRLAARLAMGLLRAGEDFELFGASDVEVRAGRPSRLVARDGERETMDAPFRFTVLRDALRVITPPDPA